MARIATTIEESRKLLGLGINPNTADMSYDWIGGKVYDLCLAPCVNEMDIPAWSLGVLLDFMPTGKAFCLSREEDGLYWIDGVLASMPSGDYIGAAVKMVEMLVNQGRIKVKEDKE